MYKLYHYPICPLSRQVRILLYELNIEFSLIKENYWERRSEFLSLNPAANLPVLVKENLNVIGIYPILEYLSENYETLTFRSFNVTLKCEIRRIIEWFNIKFFREVSKIIIDEKVIKRFISNQNIKLEYIKIAKSNLNSHLSYLSRLLESRSFLADEVMSYADITAGAHISVIDYFGEINWDLNPQVKDWYSVLKSRPSFRAILQDIVPGFKAASSYADLDF